VKILFTGLGSIGTRHLKLLKQRNEDHRFLAYRSGKGENKKKYSGVEEYSDLQQALQEKPDVAFITNPTHLHVPTAISCARVGCDLFIEKPLSDSLEGVEKLEKLAAGKDLITYLACNLRFHPVLVKTRELLEAGKIGSVRYFRVECGSYLPDWRPARDYRSSYSADPDRGGGVLLDLIHEIDYSCWLFGRPDNVKGAARKISDLKIKSNDFAEMIFEFDADLSGSIQLDYFSRVPRRMVQIQGEKGMLVGDLLQNNVKLQTAETEELIEFEEGMESSYESQIDYFLEHVKEHKKCENDIRQGKKILKLVLKLRNS
jgi:predicted dehydrogenase